MLKRKVLRLLQKVIDDFLKQRKIDAQIKWALETPPKNIEADYAINAAMIIAKVVKTSPRQIAIALIEKIKVEMADIVSDVFIAGAGFINIRIRDEILFSYLKEILTEKNNFAKNLLDEKKKVLVEFVSANPTGPLHIGHGRGAAIGDSLARILKYAGAQVVREYYLNDAGNQMRVLGKSTEIRYRQLKGEKIDFPEGHYQGEYIYDIAKRLIKENQDPNKIDFCYQAQEDILKTIKADLKSFGVEFDIWFKESSLASKKDENGLTDVDKICLKLKQEGFAYEQDAALWLATTKFKDDKDRVLKRSDGNYTYFASDISYHKNKFDRGFDTLIDLWGADHHGYVERINAAIQMLGFNKDALEIILYQLVSLIRNGQLVAMSTRSGEFITLREVVDEVGKDACRFFFLLRAPDSQLDFDLELAKKSSAENPVFYVQYVNARCNSILEAAKNDELDLKNINFNLLSTKEERDLIKKLIAFSDTLLLCIKTLSPHHFTVYLIELADLFHKFYETNRVLTDDKNLTKARLALIKAVMIIIESGLNLIGVSAPKKM